MRKVVVWFGLFGAVLMIPSSVLAQRPVEKTRWGVTGGWSPWQVPSTVKSLFDVDEINVKGSDLDIGFVRGTDKGGDWGVSFVRKTLASDASLVRSRSTICGTNQSCVVAGTTYFGSGAALVGGKIHKFVSFGTIANRVQIGLTIAAGAASVQGTISKKVVTAVAQGTNFVQAETNTTVAAKELMPSSLSVVPLFDFQLGFSIIVAPGFKIKVLGGVNFPGYQVASINVVYLFGSK